jgi:hypothetical protein
LIEAWWGEGWHWWGENIPGEGTTVPKPYEVTCVASLSVGKGVRAHMGWVTWCPLVLSSLQLLGISAHVLMTSVDGWWVMPITGGSPTYLFSWSLWVWVKASQDSPI